MKNIILQHWTGKMDELGILSSTNISKYAKKVNAEYRLLRGNIFRPELSPPCQKLYMLDEEFDIYDIVVMLDMDVFTRKGMDENIFDKEIQGIGMHTVFHDHLFKQLQRKFPALTNPNYHYWGGAIYKLDKETRQKLRVHIRDKEMRMFSGTGNFEDEGIMHRLATLAKLKKQQLPGEKHWCHGSYEPGIETSAMIHVRIRSTPVGPKRPKIENYKGLVAKGLIEE